MKKFSVGEAIKAGSCLTAAVVLSSFGWTSANAATVVVSGITVTDTGRVSPAVLNSTQPVSAATTGLAQVQTGQPNSAGNPPELSNGGWDPYGLSDTNHNWWNVEFWERYLQPVRQCIECCLGLAKRRQSRILELRIFLFRRERWRELPGNGARL